MVRSRSHPTTGQLPGVVCKCDSGRHVDLHGKRKEEEFQFLVTFQQPLDDYVANVEGKLEIGGGFFSRTSSQIRFTSSGWLEALCETTSSGSVATSIILNFYLDNINGVLQFADSSPGNFMATARNVTLNTRTIKLTSSAQRFNSGWQNFELNLDYNVKNIDGRLVWLLNPHVPY
ncbi:hypothetical protein KP509_1Z033700 [Ceratopteris richardii]|nr:hypothetical protein KP509_1Z033700 [Ceratopteris richardii]